MYVCMYVRIYMCIYIYIHTYKLVAHEIKSYDTLLYYHIQAISLTPSKYT